MELVYRMQKAGRSNTGLFSRRLGLLLERIGLAFGESDRRSFDFHQISDSRKQHDRRRKNCNKEIQNIEIHVIKSNFKQTVELA